MSTRKEEVNLPGPLEELYDAQCDVCSRGMDMMNNPTGYTIDGPTGMILRYYCSAKCLAKVVDPALVRVLAQEVAQQLAKDTPK